MRIGHGYDVHKLVDGRKCIIGGVDIPCDLGLLGHSDACLLYTSPSPRDRQKSRMPSSA